MTGYLLLKTGAASFARRGACVMIRAANVSYVILKRYRARKCIPAGRVEENALVWLLNAFDNYIFLISTSFVLFFFRRYKTRSRHTEELPVSRRIPMEDILSNITPEIEGRGLVKKVSVVWRQ